MPATFSLTGSAVVVDNGSVLVPPGQEAVLTLSGTKITVRFVAGPTSASASNNVITLTGFDNSLGVGVELSGFLVNGKNHKLCLVIHSVGDDSEPFRTIQYTFYQV